MGGVRQGRRITGAGRVSASGRRAGRPIAASCGWSSGRRGPTRGPPLSLRLDVAGPFCEMCRCAPGRRVLIAIAPRAVRHPGTPAARRQDLVSPRRMLVATRASALHVGAATPASRRRRIRGALRFCTDRAGLLLGVYAFRAPEWGGLTHRLQLDASSAKAAVSGAEDDKEGEEGHGGGYAPAEGSRQVRREGVQGRQGRRGRRARPLCQEAAGRRSGLAGQVALNCSTRRATVCRMCRFAGHCTLVRFSDPVVDQRPGLSARRRCAPELLSSTWARAGARGEQMHQRGRIARCPGAKERQIKRMPVRSLPLSASIATHA